MFHLFNKNKNINLDNIHDVREYLSIFCEYRADFVVWTLKELLYYIFTLYHIVLYQGHDTIITVPYRRYSALLSYL